MLQRFLHFTAQMLILACILFLFATINSWCTGTINTLSFIFRIGAGGGITHILFQFCFPQQHLFSSSKSTYGHTSSQKVA